MANTSNDTWQALKVMQSSAAKRKQKKKTYDMISAEKGILLMNLFIVRSKLHFQVLATQPAEDGYTNGALYEYLPYISGRNERFRESPLHVEATQHSLLHLLHMDVPNL